MQWAAADSDEESWATLWRCLKPRRPRLSISDSAFSAEGTPLQAGSPELSPPPDELEDWFFGLPEEFTVTPLQVNSACVEDSPWLFLNNLSMTVWGEQDEKTLSEVMTGVIGKESCLDIQSPFVIYAADERVDFGVSQDSLQWADAMFVNAYKQDFARALRSFRTFRDFFNHVQEVASGPDIKFMPEFQPSSQWAAYMHEDVRTRLRSTITGVMFGLSMCATYACSWTEQQHMQLCMHAVDTELHKSKEVLKLYILTQQCKFAVSQVFWKLSTGSGMAVTDNILLPQWHQIDKASSTTIYNLVFRTQPKIVY